MELSAYFKSIVDQDICAVVICDTQHRIIYMNPSAVKRYEKRGGNALVGKSLMNCHNSDSNNKIEKVMEWFRADRNNNRIFTYHNPKENKDVYMIALRNDEGELIGYYEKHEYRTAETASVYEGLTL
ncbi:MAG: PAS domain-containing protein [Oscillospiraceae bacterium]